MSRRSGGVKRQLTQETILDPQKRVRELSEIGGSVRVDKTFRVKRYFRSGSEMERQARVYYSEGELQKAFVLYNKFVTLFCEKLPKQYADYNKPEYKEDRAKMKKLVKEAFPRAEELKKKLLKQFELEKEALEKKLAQEAESRQREEEERRSVEQRQKEEEERRSREAAEKRKREEAERVAAFLAGDTASPGGGSQAEGLGADQTSTAGQSADHYEEDVPQDRGTSHSEMGWTETVEKDGSSSDEHLVSNMGTLTLGESSAAVPTDYEGRSLTATNAQLAQVLPPAYEGPSAANRNFLTNQFPPGTNLAPGAAQNPVSSVRTYQSIFSGPMVAAQAPHMTPPNYSDLPPPTNPYYTSAGVQAAQLPPTDPRMQYAPYYAHGAPQGYPTAPPPGVPMVTQFSNISSNSSWGSVELPVPSYHMTPQATPTQTIKEEEEFPQGPPAFDRSTKPSYNALSTSIGGGYRMVYVPENISRRFEEAASSNTRQNIETCAILAGKLSRNQLHITHVILPKQRGGPDSCETLSEEELFDVQDQHDLITLGWIHTHPSQSAFMSSVDLHTHCSYQIMLDEAIAIVCAPRHSQVGLYMLTEPYGLDYITHCEEEGFHTHPKVPPLYEECKHVIFSQSPVEIVDLR